MLVAWDKVTLPAGQDVLAWAKEMAERKPVKVARSPGHTYSLLLSMAYHLSQFTSPKSFFLPVERLAALFQTNLMKISRAIDLMEMRKIIRCVDPNYSFTKKKAKEYAFIADLALEKEVSSQEPLA